MDLRARDSFSANSIIFALSYLLRHLVRAISIGPSGTYILDQIAFLCDMLRARLRLSWEKVEDWKGAFGSGMAEMPFGEGGRRNAMWRSGNWVRREVFGFGFCDVEMYMRFV